MSRGMVHGEGEIGLLNSYYVNTSSSTERARSKLRDTETEWMERGELLRQWWNLQLYIAFFSHISVGTQCTVAVGSNKGSHR